MTTSKVKVSAGLTVQIGDYQYARVTIEVEEEAHPGLSWEEMTDGIYEFVENAVVDKLSKLVDRAEKEGYVG